MPRQRRTINVGGEYIEIPDFPRRWIYTVVLLILAAWLIFSAFYTVDADEVGVIQRFGKFVRTTEPGLHLKLPFSIETVKKVKVQRVFKEEFGFRTLQAGVRTQYSPQRLSGESLMLTGDLNAAIVEWIVQFRVKDPAEYLFNVRNVQGTIRDISETSMRQVVGDHSVDEVIILSRKDIAIRVQQLIQEYLDGYEMGVDVVTVNLQDVNPPEPVQPAFNEVNEAKQEKERIINQAWESYNTVIPKARGQAEQTIRRAEGYATDRVNRARGDAEKFLAVWNEYRSAQDVTRRRLYLETMVDIIPKFERVYVVDEEQGGLVPLLQLDGKGGTTNGSP
jgi:membrane protease subunit HflK